jgi:hypothetical protein
LEITNNPFIDGEELNLEEFVNNNIEEKFKIYSLQPRIYKEINFPSLNFRC